MLSDRLLFFFLILFFLVSFRQVTCRCPYECKCQSEPAHCPTGVSLVVDGCSCCKVCAKQLGEQCNGRNDVCDIHRNLFCDFSAAQSGNWGVCKSHSGRPCWFGDIHVTSGTMYKPSCKKRCWCIDGAIGCVPLCPHEAKVPQQSRCPSPSLARVPGQCCRQWTCHFASGRRYLSMDEFWNRDVDDKKADTFTPIIGNGIRDGAIYEDDMDENIDELLDYQMMQTLEFGSDIAMEDDNWRTSNAIPGDSDAQLIQRKSSVRCRIQTSEWSLCSKSCGLGVSIRVTNSNANCQLVKEQRLCEMRPCNDSRYSPKKGRHCLRHKRSRKRVTLKYAGCESVKKVKPRYCGSCHDDSKCCTPKQSRTVRLLFRCKNGRAFTKNILEIRGCHCHDNCTSITAEQQVVGYSLFGDMYRPRDR